MKYAEAVTAAQRQAILLALYFAAGYSLPSAALRDSVERTGYTMSADKLATEVAWLAEMDLVTVDDDLVRLTDRGEDIALGRAQTPGVRRPSPGETNGPR